ncbi:M36 family metallopeptidase [Nannocystis radixulma]|uniref:M36 family metallopeptidase n=1 Tax=Nannocystis radixulma TaxID=2995305 RepID=A0ABT5B482_9BACT|nr:M36 family metallopeptidase [Nannocystis radixulma]MDC0668906.1 M36 family metallopeptidase [Nannocystis radixulma]
MHIAATAGLLRDSGLDAQVITHEFGHFLHHRLTDCGSTTCWAESEGWGDFLALLLSARAGDDLDGVFLNGIWASREATAYFNGRRFASSTDPAYNALSFRHIGDGVPLPEGNPIFDNGIPNSEVHNAGEIWSAMLWDAYVALHRRREGDLEFDEVRRLMSDYVVAGMMLAPPDPTYTEQRDALLMAIAASSEADMLAVAGAFAGRGAGSCAVSPPRFSANLTGVVEDFELRGRGAILSATLDDSLDSCDHDGVVDRDELGRLEVEVMNSGMAPLPAGTTLEVVAPPAGLAFPDGPAVSVPELAPMQQHTVTIPVAVTDDLAAPTRVALDLRLTVSDACEETTERRVHAHVQADFAADGATVDDVEAGAAWTLDGDHSDTVWSRVATDDGYVWHGANSPKGTDTRLVSPPFTVAKDQDFVLRLDHAFSFDMYGNNPYDGGVIELSSDDGATWHDLGQVLGETGYTGEINGLNNKLHGRRAFVGASPGYPALKPLVLEFGKKLAGLTMRLRFRIGTSFDISAPGWTIDNLSFEGLVDAPFPRWIPDAAACAPSEPTGGEEPTTSGGEDLTTGATGASDTDSDGPATGGSDAEDTGCGCVADTRGADWLGHALALSLLALRRRRSRR